MIVEGIILGVPGPDVSTDQLVQYLGSSLQMDYREETKPYESSVQSSSLIREKHVPNIHGISEPSCCYTGSLMCLLKDQRPFLAPSPLKRVGAPSPLGINKLIQTLCIGILSLELMKLWQVLLQIVMEIDQRTFVSVGIGWSACGAQSLL